MTKIQKLMVIVQVLITKIKLKLTSIELYQLELVSGKHNKHIIAYCLRTKKYYTVCRNMFYKDHINYTYNKALVAHSIMKGRRIGNVILLS